MEPSVYAGKFAWNKTLDKPEDARPYRKEIIMNVVAVNAEVARVCCSLVSCIKKLPPIEMKKEVQANFGLFLATSLNI